MREIKFRAFDRRQEKYLWPYPEGFALLGEVSCFDLISQQLRESTPHEPTLSRIGDIEIMQYTGLKDKNGKEAYEGDICVSKKIEGGAYYYQIFGVAGGFAINTHQDDFSKHADDIVFYEGLSDMQTMSWFRDCVEIIGNIYENPELLTNQPMTKLNDFPRHEDTSFSDMLIKIVIILCLGAIAILITY